MKKVILIIVLFLSLFVFASCANVKGNETESYLKTTVDGKSYDLSTITIHGVASSSFMIVVKASETDKVKDIIENIIKNVSDKDLKNVKETGFFEDVLEDKFVFFNFLYGDENISITYVVEDNGTVYVKNNNTIKYTSTFFW